jgi:hypothetical protein
MIHFAGISSFNRDVLNFFGISAIEIAPTEDLLFVIKMWLPNDSF